jgi:hypothetical protein
MNEINNFTINRDIILPDKLHKILSISIFDKKYTNILPELIPYTGQNNNFFDIINIRYPYLNDGTLFLVNSTLDPLEYKNFSCNLYDFVDKTVDEALNDIVKLVDN